MAPRLPTPQQTREIAQILSLGAPLDSAALHADVDPELALYWFATGQRQSDGPHYEFYNSCRKAISSFEIENLALIGKAATKEWKAAKWRLERRIPERWAEKPATANTADVLDKLREKLSPALYQQIVSALNDKPIVRGEQDPEAYCKKQFGLELWSRQAEIARAIAEHPKVAVKSGHKIGKSITAAMIALWWTSDPLERPGARVVITAPTDRQIRSIIWKELRGLYMRAALRGQELGGILHKDPGTGLQWPDGREIVGLSTNEPEKIAGYSGAHLLFIVDEASGVEADIFEAIEGNRAGDAKLFLIGNPTRLSGEFFEAFTSPRAGYHTIHVSSTQTPNAMGKTPIPGLATKTWIEEMRKKWGEDDPRFAVRVLGEFPDQGSASVIPLRYVNEGISRWPAAAAEREPFGPGLEPEREPLSFGLDPARYGDDDAILSARMGKVCLGLYQLRKGSGDIVAGHAWQFIKEIAAGRGVNVAVNVDVIGIGASVYDALVRYVEAAEDLDYEIEIVAVNVANAAREPAEHHNLRSELWFVARNWLRDGGAIPDDPQLKQELTAPEYDFAPSGACRVEAKEQTKRRLSRSPDRADALLLSLYERPSARYTSVRGKSRRH